MKLSKLSQLFLVSSIGLVVATVLTGCQLVTIDYLFVTTSVGSGVGSAGQIQTFAVDSETGALRIVDPAVPSGGVGPIAMAVTSDYQNLYVANQGNNSVVHFQIAQSGVLTSKDTITTSATPVSLAVNAAGTYLYVISGTTSATLTEYALSSGTIGAAAATKPLNLSSVNASFAADTIIPTGINVLANSSAVYVTAYDQSAYNPGGSVSSTANPGWIFGFNVGTSGALTAAASPYQAGVKPTAIASDPTNRFVYATDFASNQLIGYTIGTANALNFMVSGPFRTGNEPEAVQIDPRGIYMYVANTLDSSVTGYTITLATGAPSALSFVAGSANNATDTQPVSITIDPALGRFVYSANHLGNSVSGFRLDPTTGTLSLTQATPYPTGNAPTAVITVPHGNHSLQQVTP